jgi:hypothetical protein
MSSAEVLQEIDAALQIVAFGFATLLPLIAVCCAFFFLRRMRLVYRAALVIAVNIVSLPVAFVLLMELALLWSPSGRPGPGTGIIAVPMVGVWLLTAVVSAILLIGLVIGRWRRPTL